MLLLAISELGAAARLRSAEAMSSMSGDTCLWREKAQPRRSRPSAAGVLTREMTQENDATVTSKAGFYIFRLGRRRNVDIDIVYVALERS